MIVCVPTERWLVEKLGPLPIVPSRSDVQRRADVRFPSVTSLAVPLKVTVVPAKTRVPAGGDVIVTTGAEGAMITRACAVLVAPSESVTVAVSVWLPSVSVTVRGPEPS